jgi:hypothetical protein
LEDQPVKLDANTQSVPRKDANAPDAPPTSVVSRADFDRLQAELDTLKAQRRADSEEKAREAAIATDGTMKCPECGAKIATDGVVADSITVRLGAAKLDSKIDTAAKRSNREIMIDTIKACDPDFKSDGKSEDYLRARFDMEIEASEKRAKRVDSTYGINASTNASHEAIGAFVAERADSASQDDGDMVARARAKMVDKNANAWKVGK